MLKDRQTDESSQSCNRNPGPSPTAEPRSAARLWHFPQGGNCFPLIFFQRSLRQEHDFAAAAACGHVRQNLIAFWPQASTAPRMPSGSLHRGAFRIGLSGSSDCLAPCLESESPSQRFRGCGPTDFQSSCTWIGSGSELCSSFLKSIFKSRSRGSVPSASSAAVRFIPLLQGCA